MDIRWNDIDEFTVEGSFTNIAGAFQVGENSPTRVNLVRSWNRHPTLSNGGSLEVWFEDTFDVMQDISNSGTFVTNGEDDAAFTVTNNVDQSGSMDLLGLEDSGTVTVENNFTQTTGSTTIPNAVSVTVENDLTVADGSFNGNLGMQSPSIDNTLSAGTLTVGDSTSTNGAAAAKSDHLADLDATFDVSTYEAVARDPQAAKINGVIEADDKLIVAGATAVREDGQLLLRGYEMLQGGDFALLGFGDAPFDPDTDPDSTDNGLMGIVRFNNTADPVTVETDESSNTYLNSLAIQGAGIELASNVSLNTAPVSVSDGIARDFGTLFLESGNIVTGSDTLFVLTAQPTSGSDLAQAIQADEIAPAGVPTAQSPVIGGSRNSYVNGIMSRPIDETGSTGGFVTDGYIYPLGSDVEGTGEYQAIIIEPATNALPSRPFVTISIINDQSTLPALQEGLVSGTNGVPLNLASQPFLEVTVGEGQVDEDFNARILAGNLRPGRISSNGISDVKQMRIIQQDGDMWQEAGVYEIQGDPNDDTSIQPNSVISGVPSIIHEGIDFTGGAVLGLATDDQVNPLTGAVDTEAAIAGAITYGGNGVEGVTVTASDGDTEFTATTDADGNYVIAGVDPGTYEVSASVSGAVSGVNSTDALLAVRGFAGLTELSDFQTELADVNDSGNVNATDALLIAQFGAGAVTSFEAGTFASTTATADASTQNVQGADLTVAAYGDVNTSGSIGGGSEAALSVSDISSAAKSAPSIDGVEGWHLVRDPGSCEPGRHNGCLHPRVHLPDGRRELRRSIGC